MLYSFLISFFEWKINDISFAEIITILFLCYTFLYKSYTKTRFTLSMFFLISFVVWIIINNLSKFSDFYYVTSSFRNNIIRLCFYVFGFYKITEFLKGEIQLYSVIRGLRIIVITTCILGLIEFAFSIVNIDLNFFLLEDTEKIGPTTLRASSIFSEPAHFSIFIATSSFIIIRYYYIYGQLKKINNHIYLVFITLLSTLSFTGYVFFLFLFFYYLFLSAKNKDSYLVKIFLPAMFIVILVIFGLQHTPFFQNLILNRWSNVLSGTDGSSNFRILGAFEIITLLKDNNLLTGIGLGQFIPYFSSFEINTKLFGIYDGLGGINNILSLITVETGLIGLVLFLLFVISFIRGQIVYFIVFIIFSFSWGFFNTPFFWFYIYLSKALIEKKVYLADEDRINYLRLLRKHASFIQTSL